MCSDDLGNHAQGTSFSEGKGSKSERAREHTTYYIQVANKFRLHRCARTGASSALRAAASNEGCTERALFQRRGAAPLHFI